MLGDPSLASDTVVLWYGSLPYHVVYDSHVESDRYQEVSRNAAAFSRTLCDSGSDNGSQRRAGPGKVIVQLEFGSGGSMGRTVPCALAALASRCSASLGQV